MPRSNTLVFAGLLIALSGAHLAPAQTAATQKVALLQVQAGNGQVACECLDSSLQTFQPISVKATDNTKPNGLPVTGATITWAVTSGQMTLSSSQATIGYACTSADPSACTSATTTTGADGTSTISISLIVIDDFTTGEQSYMTNNVQASSNNFNVFFTETQSLLTASGNSAIEVAGDPSFNGGDLNQATLSAPVTTTLKTAIQVDVAGLEIASAGVANVAVRLINNQNSPTLTCASNGGYADPGSVLTVSKGIANCFPQFNGSGSGTFYLTVGGPPAANISSAAYLQSFGPYNFTSIPGNAAAIQIVSGDYQIGSGLNPLVARVVDANGYAVQNQTVTWGVTPAGAAALTNEQTVSDNNGVVSVSASLFLPAASGALITVTLQSNPAIYAVFQETLAGHITGLTKVSSDESAQAGTNFPNPLVVQVNGTGGPVANYPLQFLTSGSVSLPGGTTVYTNASGQVSVTALAGLNTGTATVTAVAGTFNVVFNLTVTSTPNVVPNSLTIVSGNPQSAMPNANFPAALVVQVGSTAGPLPSYVVNFSSSGPINISSGAATTGLNGQAQINVQAGATPGAATVTASVPGYSVTFNLTVTPAGPVLTANSFLNAASRVSGSISPCSLAIVSAPGLTPNGTSDLSLAPVFGRLPLSVHGLSITIGGYSAPIMSVAMGATNPEATIQVPCEVTPGSSIPVSVTVDGGGTSAPLNISVQAASPGIFQTMMSDGVLRAAVVRSDGTFADVGGTPLNPARRGENIRLYATGLGPTVPPVGTDNIQDPGADLIGFDAKISDVLQVGIVNYGGLQIVSARQAPDLIGVYEVQVLLPNDVPTGNNVQIAIAAVPSGSSTAVSSIAALIPIQ